MNCNFVVPIHQVPICCFCPLSIELKIYQREASPGLVVIGRDLESRGLDIESWHQRLDVKASN